MKSIAPITPQTPSDRLYSESFDALDARDAYPRDRDRIIHSRAFRRLQHKTQVFMSLWNDHHRTRLTHSLEVSQIARSLAREHGGDETLAEAISLAHDLGHPPFGHAGENELDKLLEHEGGFDHNVQTLRIITKLEGRYLGFDGLNLTQATLEGTAKHSGPIVLAPSDSGTVSAYYRDFAAQYSLNLETEQSLPALWASVADDFAYVAHDLDDGVRAGIVDFRDFLHLEPLARVLDDLSEYSGLDREAILRQFDASPVIDDTTSRLWAEVIRRIIRTIIGSVSLRTDNISHQGDLSESFSHSRPSNFERVLPSDMVDFLMSFKSLLMQRLYSNVKIVNSMQNDCAKISQLYKKYLADKHSMPDAWLAQRGYTPRSVADYIAGMTDPFLIKEHERLFS